MINCVLINQENEETSRVSLYAVPRKFDYVYIKKKLFMVEVVVFRPGEELAFLYGHYSLRDNLEDLKDVLKTYE